MTTAILVFFVAILGVALLLFLGVLIFFLLRKKR